MIAQNIPALRQKLQALGRACVNADKKLAIYDKMVEVFGENTFTQDQIDALVGLADVAKVAQHRDAFVVVSTATEPIGQIEEVAFDASSNLSK